MCVWLPMCMCVGVLMSVCVFVCWRYLCHWLESNLLADIEESKSAAKYFGLANFERAQKQATLFSYAHHTHTH